MCRYSAVELSSTDCDLYNTASGAHRYTKYVYWLCADSRHNKPCEKRVPKEQQIGNDIGSRQGSCPVCNATYWADERYKAAYAEALNHFNAVTNKAWEQKEKDLKKAQYVEETVRYGPAIRDLRR